jgi:hypothetical protein
VPVLLQQNNKTSSTDARTTATCTCLQQVIDERLQQLLASEAQAHVQLTPAVDLAQRVQQGEGGDASCPAWHAAEACVP